MPAISALSTKARQRCSGMLVPMAAAAVSSSREARSRRPVRDSLNSTATTMAPAATAAARCRSVALGRPNRVRGPLVTSLQCSMIVCSTTRSANEVITAAASDRRMSGYETTAATAAATRPPIAIAR